MGLSVINEQKIGEFSFSKKGKIHPLSAGKMFSVKKEIAGKKIPERLSKNLFTFKKVFLQGDIPVFPELYSRPALELFNLIGSPWSFGKSENLNAAAENHESASTLWDHKSKRLLRYNRSEKIFTTYFTNAFQQYLEANNEIRAGVYERIFIPLIEEQTENLQSVLMQSVLKLNSPRNAETKSSGHTVTRALNWLTAFTKNTVKVSQFNRHVSHTLGSTKILQINQQVSHTSGNIKVLQLNQQETRRLESEFPIPYSHLRIKTTSRTLISLFNSLGVLLAGNKLTHTIGTYTTDSQENIIQKKRYHYLSALLRKTFKLPKTQMFLSTAAVEAGNPAHLWKIPVIREYNNTATQTLEQLAVQVPGFITARIFKKLVALKPDMIKEYIFNYKAVYSAGVEKAYSPLHFASRVLNYAGIRTSLEILRSFKVQKSKSKVAPSTDYSRAGYHLSGPYAAGNSIADKQNVDNIGELRELKRGRHYSIAGSKLQSTISQPVFLKSPETSTYRPRRAEALLYSSKQSFRSNKTAVPVSGLHEACNLEKRAGLALSSLLLLSPGIGTSTHLPKKHMLEYLKIIFSPSDFTILSKVQKLIIGGKLSLNGLLSDKSFDPSLTSLSETDRTASEKKVISLFGIPLFDLSKYASVRISQNPVFARKSGVRLKTETENLNRERLDHKNTYVSHLNERQKLIGQKNLSRKTARISLCWGGGKKENSNMGSFLLRSSLNLSEKSNQQVNKNMNTPAELRTLQVIFSGSVFSTRPDFTPTKWKNFISTFIPGKKLEKRKDMPGRFLFEFKSFRNSDKTAKSHLYLGPQNTYFTFMRTGTDKTYGFDASETSGKESSYLLHAVGSMHKTGREDLVYWTPQTLLDEVKKIEKIAFETKEAVADHFESHSQQEAGKAGQVMDIEYISKKVMQNINSRLKIEVERRRIF